MQVCAGGWGLFYQPEASVELGTSLELAAGLDCWCRYQLSSVFMFNKKKK